MACSEGMPAAKAGELWHKCSHEYLARSYLESRSHQSSWWFVSGWFPSLVYLSPYLMGVLKQSWIFFMEILSITIPSFFFHDLDYVITGLPWQTGLDNAKMYVCCLIHCWSIATRCSCTARTEDIGWWSACFLWEVRFWKITMIKICRWWQKWRTS